MLKNLFQIPDTFDPDDRRRREILNILLIVWTIIAVLVVSSALVLHSGLEIWESYDLIVLPLVSLLIAGVLLTINRSPKIPSWISGAIFLTLFTTAVAQSDIPTELYNGRSTIVWAVPIIMAAVIFAPQTAFWVTALICGFMQLFTPVDAHYADPINYFSMVTLLLIAFISWLGMSIANRAIRDARREAANLRAIYEYVADGVLVLDRDGGFASANPALLKMIPEAGLREIIVEPLGQIVRWKRRVFSVSASDVPEVGTVAVFREETRRHETERARDALLATASHELRTPLTATMNYLEMLQVLIKLGRVDTAEFAEHLTRAIENCKRLQHLVDDILDQAQIQAGVLELKPQTFDLRALLDKVRSLLDSLIQQKQLACELNIAADVPDEIMGDPERLHQVLVNLVGNAIKFTSRGEIKINVSTPQKDQLCIEVADSGPGIPPEQLPDIFEAFRRGSNYAQREHQGAGLGLSIAREIIIRMGGKLTAASQLGNGSTFTITLPVEAA